jgi:type I site-specific restriction endonuclease
LDDKEKKKLSETDVCDLLITPAIKSAGWDSTKQMRREVTLAPDPVVVRGNISSPGAQYVEEQGQDPSGLALYRPGLHRHGLIHLIMLLLPTHSPTVIVGPDVGG